jgi:hypothetical protein
MQITGLESVLAAKRVIEPNGCKRRASLRLAMTAANTLCAARDMSDAEQDALRLQRTVSN